MKKKLNYSYIFVSIIFRFINFCSIDHEIVFRRNIHTLLTILAYFGHCVVGAHNLNSHVQTTSRSRGLIITTHNEFKSLKLKVKKKKIENHPFEIYRNAKLISDTDIFIVHNIMKCVEVESC